MFARLGAGFALAVDGMKNAKCNPPTQLCVALLALKEAILAGTTWQYEKLVTVAAKAGATDEQIDLIAHEAIEVLFARAERPVTPRNLAQLRSVSHSRR